jgi:hypothetical protein
MAETDFKYDVFISYCPTFASGQTTQNHAISKNLLIMGGFEHVLRACNWN